jgi:hypothetical protein
MTSKRFIVGYVIVVVLIGAASIYAAATVDKADKSIVSVVSPDGKFKAVKTTLARGGASPFCVESIAVLLSVYPDDFDEHKSAYEVYAGPCAASGATPGIKWLSSTSLQIASAAPADGKAARRKPLDISKTVKVTFVPQP